MKPRGHSGEEYAALFLQARGLHIVARNWRCRLGEIDLIARDGATLVFVEVRQRASRSYGGAAESITIAKQRKLSAAAALYLASLGREVPCRFDALLIGAGGNCEWIRDAFCAR